MTDIDPIVADVVASVTDHGDEVNPEAVVRSKAEKIAGEYHLPDDELRRTIRNSLEDEAGIVLGDEESAFESTPVANIQRDEQWCDVLVEIVELWDPTSDKIAQVGLAGDDSGKIKFTSFSTSDLSPLEEGATYQLENVVGNEYQGNISINLNRNTQITEVDRDIEVGDNTVTVSGTITELRSGSGLIERCGKEDCQKAINRSDQCPAHGAVDEHEDDLRIKAVVDDGQAPEIVILDRDLTEAVTGIELDEAIKKAKDEFDRDVIARDMSDQLVGTHLTATGPVEYGSILADTVDQEPDLPTTDELLTAARSLTAHDAESA